MFLTPVINNVEYRYSGITVYLINGVHWFGLNPWQCSGQEGGSHGRGWEQGSGIDEPRDDCCDNCEGGYLHPSSLSGYQNQLGCGSGPRRRMDDLRHRFRYSGCHLYRACIRRERHLEVGTIRPACCVLPLVEHLDRHRQRGIS